MPKTQKSMVTVSLNARLAPIDRGDLEDAFNEFMDKNKHSICIVGGGTLLSEKGEVKECDLEVQIENFDDEKFQLVKDVFESMLAPKGSRIINPMTNETITFGRHEGLALYLNGTNLPIEVYKSCDSNHVYEECERLIEDAGMINSHWQGDTETALYMYGRSYEEMHQRISDFVKTYPLCQQCRIIRIA